MESEFTRLVYVPFGVDRAFKLVDQGKEIIKQQSEFWKRYAQIEDSYAKNLQNLLSLPCSTWESKDGIFAKKKVLSETGKSMDQSWKAVKNAVHEISKRHELIAEGIYQQGHVPLENLYQQTENDIRQYHESIQLLSGTIETNYKNLKRVRQHYIKLAQAHKGLNKVLDDPQLPYEKRQKLEIQSSQLKLELDTVFRSYKSLIETTSNLQREYYTKSAPEILQKLEKLQTDRIKQTKSTYNKYVANSYTVIPTMRQLCDKLIYFTDLIEPDGLVNQFIYSILLSLKEPLKVPKIPRLKPFGDTNDSDTEDELISSNFNKMTSTIQSSYDITIEKEKIIVKEKSVRKSEPKPVRKDENQESAPSERDEKQNNDELHIDNENIITIEDTQETINSTEIEKDNTNVENVEIDNNDNDNKELEETNNNNDTTVSENDNSNDTNKEEPVKTSTGWIDDMFSSTSNGNDNSFSIPSSNPFQNNRLPSTMSQSNKSLVDSSNFILQIATTKPSTNTEKKKDNLPSTIVNDKEDNIDIKETEIITSNEEEEEIKVEEQKEENLKDKLAKLLEENDYYTLFEVKQSDDLTTITNMRKEINNRLHPDHFDPSSKEKEDAVKKLIKINDVYSSVFRNQKTKTLYDKLCAYRKKYDSLLDAKSDLLQRAVTNLNLVGKAIKRANLPEELYTEVSIVLEMIKNERNIIPQ